VSNRLIAALVVFTLTSSFSPALAQSGTQAVATITDLSVTNVGTISGCPAKLNLLAHVRLTDTVPAGSSVTYDFRLGAGGVTTQAPVAASAPNTATAITGSFTMSAKDVQLGRWSDTVMVEVQSPTQDGKSSIVLTKALPFTVTCPVVTTGSITSTGS
jgi:hypothetical protein